MPSKASLYNMKAEPTFDFGTGARNLAYYNPQGNNILFTDAQSDCDSATFLS